MKYHKLISCGLFVIGALYILGCSSKFIGPEPTAAQESRTWASTENFNAQADNAVLTSMTITDIHFLPYRAELSSLGLARLTAIATYLERHGGKVTVDVHQSDELTRQERLASVRQFLLGQGLDPEHLTIQTGLPGGRGQDAVEAAMFYEKNLMPEDTATAGGAGVVPVTPAAGSSQ